MPEEMMDPKTARRILRLQSYAAKRGIPVMVFVDMDHFRKALYNMETGAIMNKVFNESPLFFVPEQRLRF
ncbi:MAG: hypothetical protein HS130_01035 [Deltaproteobacteria bacterium]|nr:hypothetical protein [Deltaproteobacteria bacterium]MCL4873829.1 hypothetical protein [bacterium]